MCTLQPCTSKYVQASLVLHLQPAHDVISMSARSKEAVKMLKLWKTCFQDDIDIISTFMLRWLTVCLGDQLSEQEDSWDLCVAVWTFLASLHRCETERIQWHLDTVARRLETAPCEDVRLDNPTRGYADPIKMHTCCSSCLTHSPYYFTFTDFLSFYHKNI